MVSRGSHCKVGRQQARSKTLMSEVIGQTKSKVRSQQAAYRRNRGGVVSPTTHSLVERRVFCLQLLQLGAVFTLGARRSETIAAACVCEMQVGWLVVSTFLCCNASSRVRSPVFGCPNHVRSPESGPISSHEWLQTHSRLMLGMLCMHNN